MNEEALAHLGLLCQIKEIYLYINVNKKIYYRSARLYFVGIALQISAHSIHAQVHTDLRLSGQVKSCCNVAISSVVGFHIFMN